MQTRSRPYRIAAAVTAELVAQSQTSNLEQTNSDPQLPSLRIASNCRAGIILAYLTFSPCGLFVMGSLTLSPVEIPHEHVGRHQLHIPGAKRLACAHRGCHLA